MVYDGVRGPNYIIPELNCLADLGKVLHCNFHGHGMCANVEITGWLDNERVIFFNPANALVGPFSYLFLGDEVEEGNLSRPAIRCAVNCSTDATH